MVNITVKNIDPQGVVAVKISGILDIPLTQQDVTHWIDAVNDAQTLRYIARYALKQAKAIEDKDVDDFRSRA